MAFSYVAGHVTGTTATSFGGNGSILHTLVVGTPAAGTITIADGSATKSVVTCVASQAPFYLLFDDVAATNWTITCSVAMDVTVNYT